MTPRVSVIVPLYNKARYVRRALDSIAAQTFADFELLVIDDGSTDGSGQLVAAHSDRRIRLITQTNAGPGAARNRGLAEARGEFAAFLDADDEWLPDYLAASVAALDEYGPQVASITFGYIEHPAAVTREPMWRARGITDGMQRLAPQTAPELVVYLLAYMSPCTTLARTEVLRRWGGFYDRERCLYAEDAFLWLKVLLNERVAFRLRPLARFHVEASGLSKNLQGARPVEPFLLDASEIEQACPPELRQLLQRVLAARALKTACVLGYWGDWRAAKALMQRFVTTRDWRLPYYAPALVCSTPLGAGLGTAWRALRSLQSRTMKQETMNDKGEMMNDE